MSDAGRKKANPAIKRTRGAASASTPMPAGDYTSIRVPKPPASAMNKDRPISSLIRAQLEHIRHAESARLPKEKRVDTDIEKIGTEAEAAAYIGAVTRVLHPQGRKNRRARAGR